MIKFIPTVEGDVDQIREWTAADPWHQNQKQPEWWLTGSEAYVCACVQDEKGPVVYLKVEEEETQFRLHCQFGPRSEVSRLRLLLAMRDGLPPLVMHLLSKGKDVVFNSSNPSLVRFMWSMGFKPTMPFKSGEYAICVAQVLKKKC
jgi:hypothetical protein